MGDIKRIGELAQSIFKEIHNAETDSPIEIKLMCNGVLVTYTHIPETHTALTTAQSKILSVFQPNESYSYEQICRLSGYSPCSRTRQVLADLVKLGHIINTPDGYSLPES